MSTVPAGVDPRVTAPFWCSIEREKPEINEMQRRMVMSKPWCCYVNEDGKQCSADARWTIWKEGDPQDVCVDGCDDHVGLLLKDGVSMVWPVDSATPVAVDR